MYFYIEKLLLEEFALSSFLLYLGCPFRRIFHLVSRFPIR